MKSAIKHIGIMLFAGLLLASCGGKDKLFSISVVSSDESKGKAYGSGEFEKGTTTIIYGTPENGYQFSTWNDGNTDNPRTITVNGNATYVASFVAAGSGDNPGDNPGGDPTPGEFQASFIFEETSYEVVAVVSMGMDQTGTGLFNLELLTGWDSENDPLVLLWILPQAGDQGLATGSSVNFMLNPYDYITAANGYNYPHYQTTSQCDYAIKVNRINLDNLEIGLTAAGEMFDIQAAEAGEDSHFYKFTCTIDGHFQYPQAG